MLQQLSAAFLFLEAFHGSLFFKNIMDSFGQY